MGARKELIVSKIDQLEKQRKMHVIFAKDNHQQLADTSLELLLWNELLKIEEAKS